MGKEIDEEAAKKILEVDDVRKKTEAQISFKKREQDLPASVLPEQVKKVAAKVGDTIIEEEEVDGKNIVAKAVKNITTGKLAPQVHSVPCSGINQQQIAWKIPRRFLREVMMLMDSPDPKKMM